MTAHTLDDQAETVLFRIGRGSGIAGLTGMCASVRRSGLTHARPLLGIAKSRLVLACTTAGWPFLVDPSNHDPRFARTRLRALMPGLAAEGLDPEQLARLSRRAARADAALDHAAETGARAATRDASSDTHVFDGRALTQWPDEIVIRILGGAVQRVGRGSPARLERLERLATDLIGAIEAGGILRRTLNGTTVILAQTGKVTIRTEGVRHRGSATGSLSVHSIANELPHALGISRGSLGNGGSAPYIEPRRNAGS